MKTTFDKLSKVNKYGWAAVLISLIATILFSIVYKINNILTILNRSDIIKNIEEYIGTNSILQKITQYTGIGVGVILIIYILILLIYILISFAIPSIVYIITKAIIQNDTGSLTNFIIYVFLLISFMPGILLDTKAIIVFKLLASIGIMMYHIIGIILIQVLWVMAYFIIILKQTLNTNSK